MPEGTMLTSKWPSLERRFLICKEQDDRVPQGQLLGLIFSHSSPATTSDSITTDISMSPSTPHTGWWDWHQHPHAASRLSPESQAILPPQQFPRPRIMIKKVRDLPSAKSKTHCHQNSMTFDLGKHLEGVQKGTQESTRT